MAKVITTIELNEDDLIRIVCSAYEIEPKNATVTIRAASGDQRDQMPASVTISTTKR